MRAARPRGSLRPLLATTLILLWIVVLGTAVPFPLFVSLREALEPTVPPLIGVVKPYIASLVVMGSRVAVLFTGLLAGSLGLEMAEPPAVDAWMVAAQRIGAFTGMVTAAAFPTWCLAVWARRRQSAVQRPASMRQVPLAIALAWTIVVARPLIAAVGEVVFPVDTWLMLPSVTAAEKPEEASEKWCAFQLHSSAFACEADRMATQTRKDENHNGYGFAGARCVSAADVPHPDCDATSPPAGQPTS